MKHTPAPWKVIIDLEEKHPIAVIDPTTEKHPQGPLHLCNVNPNLQDESYANARLIAAAPELLSLLEEFDGVFSNVLTNRAYSKADKALAKRMQDATRVAIAKATGTQS